MNYQLFVTCQLLLILLVGLVIWLLSRALLTGYTSLQVPGAERRKLLNYAIGGVILWLAILAQLAWLEFFLDANYMPYKVLGTTVLPVAVGVVLLSFRGFRLFLRLLPPAWLILGQAFRIPLELIQWMGYEGGFVPGHMTFAGLNYDIMVGLSALVAGSAFFRKGKVRRIEAMVWNVFGLGLILTMQVVLFFTLPSPFRVWTSGIDYWSIASAPFIWIPGFLTPLGILLHLYSMTTLWETPARERSFQMKKKEKESR